MTSSKIGLVLGIVVASAILAAEFAAAQGLGGREDGRGMGRGHGPSHQGNPIRHRIVRHGSGVPNPYAAIKNQLKTTSQNLYTGKVLYQQNCASCHGVTGKGDGEAGKDLRYKPANLAFVMDKGIATDGFLMWSIAEGGEELKTDMPAFKGVLTETERWQVITFLRKGF